MNSTRLILAWLAADYLVPTHGVRLRIGMPAPQLEGRCPAARHFAVLTAWNPGARPHPPASNVAAEAALDKALVAARIAFVPALNRAPGGGHEEPSRLLLDAGHEMLDRLACRFGQAGAPAWRTGEPVRLRLYGPAWRKALGDPRVDTRMIDWVACAPP